MQNAIKIHNLHTYFPTCATLCKYTMRSLSVMQRDALQSPGFFSDINGLHLSYLWPDQLIRAGTVAGSLVEMEQRAASLGSCRDIKIKVTLDHSGGCLLRFYFNTDIFYLALNRPHKLLISWLAWSFWFCPLVSQSSICAGIGDVMATEGFWGPLLN